jgi:anti-anti-sigma regulatory factor
MATKDNPAGLLSKVAKFVRNPTTNWSDLDNPPSTDAESGYSKQALKEMIERKRQNDFVRKREFDQLRKLRNREPGASPEVAGRPSFYQSSMPSNLDERAHTLKKIDEIEAQMSKQWWKGKQIDGAQPQSGFPVASQSTAEVAPEGADFAATQNSVAPGGEGGDFAKTQMAGGLAREDGARPATSPATLGPSYEPSGFNTSKLFAEELSDDASDPELEEAAIRFANGDNDGAESGLLEALRTHGGKSEFADLWVAALFDFYRATNQQPKFDSLALDIAAKVGRSAPAWMSMHEQFHAKVAEEIERTRPQGLDGRPIWVCPASLTLGAMGELHLALANAPRPWVLDWSALHEIQPDALKTLATLLATWCSQTVSLRFDGAANLDRVLRSGTPSGNKATNLLWWRMRMDGLRIMRMQDEFELVALDYCVTYEVSPPAWQDAACEYLVEGVQVTGPAPLNSVTNHSAELARRAAESYTVPAGLEDVPAVVIELTGEILGDAAEALQRLESGRHQGVSRLVVSCAKLIRVDFSAAGSILNWVANREEEGCHVQFREVHRLVGAFFNVIGINEHAKVVLRSN